MGAEYLNVDLEIRSHIDLLPLRNELGDHIEVMFCGETEPGNFILSVELTGSGFCGSMPDETIMSLCELIEGLTGGAQELWASAHDRMFDIGFNATLNSQCGQPLLSQKTLQKIASINARLTFSVYANNLQSGDDDMAQVATAQIKLVRITKDGKREPAQILIGKPYKSIDHWRCPVSMPLPTSMRSCESTEVQHNIAGEDSLQSLCLAIKMLGKAMHEAVQHGERFTYSGSDDKADDFPIEAYFGKYQL